MRKVVVLLVAALMVAGTAQTAEAKAFSVSIKTSATTVDVGGSFTLSGKVSPKAARKTVKIQRRYEGGSWTTIKKVKLSTGSRYTYTVKPTRGGPTQYRVQKPRSNGRSAKTSATKLVTVWRWRPLQEFPATGFPVTYGTRTIGGTALPASATINGLQDATWTIGGSRCTTFRSAIGIDDASTPATTASPNLFWNNGLPGETQFQLPPRNQDLTFGQNYRSFTEAVPANVSTLRLFGVGTAGSLVTLGTPQLYCSS